MINFILLGYSNFDACLHLCMNYVKCILIIYTLLNWIRSIPSYFINEASSCLFLSNIYILLIFFKCIRALLFMLRRRTREGEVHVWWVHSPNLLGIRGKSAGSVGRLGACERNQRLGGGKDQPDLLGRELKMLPAV